MNGWMNGLLCGYFNTLPKSFEFAKVIEEECEVLGSLEGPQSRATKDSTEISHSSDKDFFQAYGTGGQTQTSLELSFIPTGLGVRKDTSEGALYCCQAEYHQG